MKLSRRQMAGGLVGAALLTGARAALAENAGPAHLPPDMDEAVLYIDKKRRRLVNVEPPGLAPLILIHDGYMAIPEIYDIGSLRRVWFRVEYV